MVEGPAKLSGTGLTWTNTGRIVIRASAGGSSIFPAISEDRAIEVLPVPEAKPALVIRVALAGFDLTWPAIPEGYVLQKTLTLGTGLWVDLELRAQTADGAKSVHIEAAEGGGFYRLIRR